MRMGAGSYDAVLDINEEQADRLIAEDNAEQFTQTELLATLISIKVGEMMTGKKADYPRPSADPEKEKKDSKRTTPLDEAKMAELFKLTN